MKKVAIILLISIYALSSFGFSLREFYCCGKLKSVTLTFQQSEIQKCNKGDCCKTKFQTYKVKDKHFATAILKSSFNSFHNLPTYFAYVPAAASSFQQAKIANRTHAPPLYYGVPAYISNCVYRI